jgi:hypothetical protein
VFGLAGDFVEFEGDPQDGVLAGKSTVSARIDALVGKIKRGKKPHRTTEIPSGECGRFARHARKCVVGDRSQEVLEAVQERGFVPQGGGDGG